MKVENNEQKLIFFFSGGKQFHENHKKIAIALGK
jgi:hypothetical protein